jgi:hypothetical protein
VPVKTLRVISIDDKHDQLPMEEISRLLDSSCELHPIGELNWKNFDYRPEVYFAAARSRNEFLLKYHVRERWFKAEKTLPNQEVYEDSCVEFFVAPSDDGIYYNFEFNAIGTCLMGSGTGRHDRKRSDPSVIAGIRYLASAGSLPLPEREGDFEWKLTLAIPFSTLFLHSVDGRKGDVLKANFYKCGDKLSVPHYLSWNPVTTEKPDFHRPEYFGLLEFA